MKIIIAGGSGQVGAVLARHFQRASHEVVVLSRGGKSAPSWRSVAWDGRSLDRAWTSELEGADAVINLAGRSVNCRYTPANRREILESRLDSTRAIGEALRHCRRPPRIWLQASTATIYAHRFDAPNDELTGILGGEEPNLPDTWRFSLDVANSWERVAREFAGPATRQVLLRSAITLSPDRGGAFQMLLNLVRCGLGGTNGSGRQFVSWIHDQDFCRAVDWLLEREDLAGPINLAAPNPVPNREFMGGLRQAWGMPIGLPSTEWMLELGALVLRTETELILKSRRVSPGLLQGSGFDFSFPDWPGAALDLCRRWRTGVPR